jgi:hypothetical protein
MSSSSVPCSSVLSRRCPYALLLDADDLLLGVSLLHTVNCFFSVGRGGNGVLQNKASSLSVYFNLPYREGNNKTILKAS